MRKRISDAIVFDDRTDPSQMHTCLVASRIDCSCFGEMSIRSVDKAEPLREAAEHRVGLCDTVAVIDELEASSALEIGIQR